MEELYNPYNDKNSEISNENIKQLFESFNIFYNINNLDLFKRAFIHRSYVNDNVDVKLVQRPYNCIELKKLASNMANRALSLHIYSIKRKKRGNEE